MCVPSFAFLVLNNGQKIKYFVVTCCLLICFFSFQFNGNFCRSYDHGNGCTMAVNNCDEDGIKEEQVVSFIKKLLTANDTQ